MRVDEATAAATLNAAWDLGIRYFDTAPYYGRGLSEIRLGRFLDTKPRSEFVLSTKVGRWFFPPIDPDAFETSPWAGGLHFDHVHDYSYDGLMRSYEQSQMRLGISRIDLLVIHDLDFWFHSTEPKVAAHLGQLFSSGWRALEQLRAHRLVRGVGAGINEVGMIPRFLDALGLDFFLVALRYTLMEQDVLETEFPYCERAGRDKNNGRQPLWFLDVSHNLRPRRRRFDPSRAGRARRRRDLWSETQPQKRGRSFVYRAGARRGAGTRDTRRRHAFSVRTRAHEYGGGSFAVSDGVVYFSNNVDQRLYRQGGAGAAPDHAAPTAAPPNALRYADGVVDRRRGHWFAFREAHTGAARRSPRWSASTSPA